MRQTKQIFLILLISLFTSAFFYAQQRQVSPVRLDKLAPGIYQILGGRGANGGVYVGEKGVLVIDAKMTKESVDQVLKAIKQITDKPIKYLVNTHSDGDHIAGNRYFPKSVTFVAHENCRKDFFLPQRNGEASPWKNPGLLPYVPSLTFSRSMTIYMGAKKIELWYFGIGHTTGDIVVYFPEEKIAFIGDQIFMGRPQLIHSYKGGNSFEHVKTLTKMLNTLDAEKFCSGHSDPVDRAAVQHHIEEIVAIQKKVKSLISQGKTLEDIKGAFPENHARLITSIFNEIKNK